MNAFSNPGSATFGYRMNRPDLNTQAQRDSLLTHGLSSAKTKLDVVDAKGSRELFNMAGGPAALALGGEWRKTYVNTPSQTGTADGSVFASYNGGYTQDEDVWAVYGEVLLPVIKTLELSAAVRYDHYDSFNSTTPKFSAKWTPIQQVALRASYAEGFRAPNAAESSAGHLAAFGLTTATRSPWPTPSWSSAIATPSGSRSTSSISPVTR